jgi:hypothetical protein
MSIDWTINLSHLVTVFGLLMGAVAIVYAIKSDVRIIKAELDSLKVQITKITDVLVHIGRQDERINSHERRISKLEDN